MGEKKKILLAENEKIIALDLKNTLKAGNYQVIDIVQNLSLIIRYLSTQNPDLLITTLKGTGNFPEFLRNVTEDYGIPVLVVTGAADFEIAPLREIKRCSFLRKPYEHGELLAIVKEIIGN